MKALTVVRQALGISWTDVHARRCVRVWTWGPVELFRVRIRRCPCRGGRLVYEAGRNPFLVSSLRAFVGAVLIGALLGAGARAAIRAYLADVHVTRSGGVR